MPGRNGADNKFGVSPFIVGQSLGDGCNYAGGAGIQQAINDCFAAGGGIVWLRSATVPYVVDLTLREGVDLNSTGAEGRLPTNPNLDKVTIQGQHTFAPATGTFVECVCEDISFIDPTGGACFTLSPTGGTPCIFAVKFSGVTSDDGAGAGNGFLVTPDATSFVFIASQTCNIHGGATALNLGGAGQAQVQIFQSSFDSDSANAITMGSAANGVQISYSTGSSNGGFVIEDLTGTGNIFIEHSALTGLNGAISFTTPGGSCQSAHASYGSNNVGTFVINGTGTFLHADTIQTDNTSVTFFDPAVIENISPWTPYAQAGASAAPITSVPRGTSAFDSSQFTVTNGFVQFTGTLPPMTWVDQALSITVNPNQGNFATAAVNLTLPAGASQGNVCKFKAVSPAQLIVIANAGQTLQVGNQAGTQAANTLQGDAIEFTFRFGDSTWWCDENIGNWNVT